MPEYTPENIHIGAGALTLEFAGDEAPVNVGYTRGFNIEVSPKLLEIFADQSLDAIEQFIISRDTKGSVEMLEMTTRNLVSTLGGDPSEIVIDEELHTETYTIKSNMVAPPSAKLIYKVPRPFDETKFITIELLRVQSSGGLKLTFQKDKENVFTFGFKALASDVNGVPVIGTVKKDQYATEYTP